MNAAQRIATAKALIVLRERLQRQTAAQQETRQRMRELAIALHDEGFSERAIAEWAGVSGPAVHRWLT